MKGFLFGIVVGVVALLAGITMGHAGQRSHVGIADVGSRTAFAGSRR